MSKYFCKQHNAVWFKRGQMKNFAHPVLDPNTGSQAKDGNGKPVWCNMPVSPPDETAPSGETPQKATPAPQSELSSTSDDLLDLVFELVHLIAATRMSKDEWKEKDNQTRISIHRQSASDRAVSLVVAEQIPLDAVFNWADYWFYYYETGEHPMRPIQAPPAQPPISQEGQAKNEPLEAKKANSPDLKALPVLNMGAVSGYALDHFKLNVSQWLDKLGCNTTKEILTKYKTPKGAWEALVDKMEAKRYE